jgi:hypothetical protein
MYIRVREGLGENTDATSEIILIAGANYPSFKQAGTRWKRSRDLSPGPWRKFCLKLAEHRLKANPKLKVTLFDFLLGTRENVQLDAKNTLKTTVEQSLVSPRGVDYWNLVGIDLSNPDISQVLTAGLQPGNKHILTVKPQVSYFDGATSISHGKSIKLLDYLNATSMVTKPVISITDVYAYIEGFADTAKAGALLELHFFAHAFNVARGLYSGGPILLNSLDLQPFQTDRHRLDKDARAVKDFRKPTMDPVKFAQAFAADAKSFVWGCNFQRGFIRQFVVHVSKNSQSLVQGKLMKISYGPDWGSESEFRTRLGLAATAAIKDVSVTKAMVETILCDANQVTYMQKLATASGRPVIGGPPGTYADYDSKKSPLTLAHIPMSKDPFGDADVSFERALLFFKVHLGFSFDTTFGNHKNLGRGYMIYDP